MPSFRKKPNGKYELRVEFGYRPGGKRDVKTRTVAAKNDKEARKLLLEFQFEMDQTNSREYDRMTFEELVNNWREKYAEQHFERTTLSNYESKLRLYILPYFSAYRVREIGPLDIVNFLQNVKGVKTKVLGYETMLDLHKVLSSIFDRAKMWMIVQTNPMDGVKRPRKESTKKKEIYSLAEAQEVVEKLIDQPLHWRVAILLALFGGLRRSELLAIEEHHFDAATKTLRIEQGIVKADTEIVIRDDTKTFAGRRNVVLPDFVADPLYKLIMEVRRNRLAMGALYEQNRKWILCNEFGHFFYPTSPNKWWRKFCNRAEIRHIPIHHLRHTHTSILLYLGVDPNTTAKRLGHSDSKTTLEIYGHLIKEGEENVANELQRQFGM